MKWFMGRLRGLTLRLKSRGSRLLGFVSYWLSFLRSPRQIIAAWPEGEIALGPRVAIFVHYDRNGQVGHHTLHYIAALRDCGFSILFVTNSGKLLPAALAALKPLCAGVLVRRNIGYDFGAMREGLEHLGLPRANTDMVLIANDSVYGPFGPLQEHFERIDFERADFWGATESWQQRYHLQSYFVVAGRTVLEHSAWKKFWRSVRPVNSKNWVIYRYEVGMTQALVRAGLRTAALWHYHDLVDDVNAEWLEKKNEEDAEVGEPMDDMRRIHAYRIRLNAAARGPLNPASELWRQLIRAGYPFIKRELLRLNPSGVADLSDWRTEVTAHFGPIPEAIEHDLRRVLRNRVG